MGQDRQDEQDGANEDFFFLEVGRKGSAKAVIEGGQVNEPCELGNWELTNVPSQVGITRKGEGAKTRWYGVG